MITYNGRTRYSREYMGSFCRDKTKKKKTDKDYKSKKITELYI